MLAQFLLFSAVGAVGTVVHFIVLSMMIHLTAFSPVSASAAGFVVGALINYRLNYMVTFKSRSLHSITLARFFAVALTGLGINSAIMAIMTERLHFLLSQALATALVLVWNFFCNRFWTFKESPSLG